MAGGWRARIVRFVSKRKENLLPVKQGDVIGTLDVIVDGKTIATYDVYSDTNASKSTYLSKTIKTLKYLF